MPEDPCKNCEERFEDDAMTQPCAPLQYGMPLSCEKFKKDQAGRDAIADARFAAFYLCHLIGNPLDKR